MEIDDEIARRVVACLTNLSLESGELVLEALELDSFDLVLLATELEDTFSIKVPPERLFDGSLGSVERIVDLVKVSLAGKG